MVTKVPIDKAGRVVLPKPVRDAFRLSPGDTLSLHSEGDTITLRPLRPQAPLKKELGIWVYQGEPSDDPLAQVIDRRREERLRELAG